MTKNKTLLIVESPAKAKTISKYLGSNYIVRASYGHIVDLTTTGKNKLGIDVENNFKAKYEVISDKKDKLKSIIDASTDANKIYIASDPDREGEAIAWHLADELKVTGLPIKRVIFNEITKNAIIKAVNSPGPLNQDLYDAQQARRFIDRIVGFLVSPFLIKKFGKNYSAGRVQSIAVKMTVDREREIEKFTPEEYWDITAALAKPVDKKDMFVAKYLKKVDNKTAATKVKTDLDSDTYLVSSLKQQEKKKNPYPPLITSTLTAAVAAKYKFPAAKTMKAAQTLYEAGHITYMRTDSVRSSPESIVSCRQWLTDNGHDIPSSPNTYKSKKNSQDAHEAIRPTDITVTPDKVFVNQDEQKVYRIIWERFIASQMKPAKYDTATITIKSSSGHILGASGRILKYKGWLAIASDMDDSNKNNKLPLLKNGDKLVLVPPKVKAVQKFTKPPSRYSEQTLIKELEKKGIGRPSTYASIMSKITSKDYVKRKSNTFYATEKGKKVVDGLKDYFDFMKYEYTANMESLLDEIADGKLKYIDMLNGFYNPFKGQLKKAYLSNEKDYGFKCSKCGSMMLLKHGKFGYFLACSNFTAKPKCKTTLSCEVRDGVPVLKEKNFEVKIVKGIKCPKCKSEMAERDGRFGKFYSCTKFPKCKGSRKKPYGKKCSDCGEELYATTWKGDSVLFCMGYPKCKHSEKLTEGAVSNPEDVVNEKLPKEVQKYIN